MAERHWLVKSEADVYSIDDLERERRTSWEGIRNYQARNNLRAMKEGDLVLFYHSNAAPPGVVGLARVAREAYPDPFAFRPGHRYHDPKSDPDDPRWFMVDLEFVERFERMVPLQEIRDTPGLEDMVLVKRARLSVQPVTAEELRRIREMGRRKD